MTEPVPAGFSWSASRHGKFEDCPKAYFFHYYLATGKVLRGDRARCAEAKRLRNLTTAAMWVGSRVHDAVEGVLRRAVRGEDVSLPAARDAMLARMRSDFLESANDAARQKGDYYNKVRFHEHEYGPEREREYWKTAADDAVAMFEAWTRMPYLGQVRSLASGQVLGIEELESWSFRGVKVWVKIDLAFRDDEGRVHVVDWKTGRQVTPENPIQMTGYAVYAQQAWHASLDALAVREVYLRLDDPEKWCRVDEDTIADAQAQMLESIRGMVGALVDPTQDVAEEEDFPPAPTAGKCARCPFRAICPDKVILE